MTTKLKDNESLIVHLVNKVLQSNDVSMMYQGLHFTVNKVADIEDGLVKIDFNYTQRSIREIFCLADSLELIWADGGWWLIRHT